MAAVLPCDATPCMQPCADRFVSKAKRRVLRDRRNVVGQAQRMAVESRQYLDGSRAPGDSKAWIPNLEAPRFIPWSGVEVDEASYHFVLKSSDIIGGQSHTSGSTSLPLCVHECIVPVRSDVTERHAEILPPIPVISLDIDSR